MITTCALCNTLVTVTPPCSCGETMLDQGPVTDYMGPYSPYYNTSFTQTRCHHLFSCPSCGRDQVIPIPLCLF